MTDIHNRLLRLAQQLEDQHAPQHMTILMREAANRLSNHRKETLDYLGQVGQLSEELERLRAEVKVWQGHTKTAVWSDSEECKMLAADNERLRAALREIASYKADEDEMDWADTVLAMNATARAALEGK